MFNPQPKPSKHKNKYLCSDGTKVTQGVIDRKRSESYSEIYNEPQVCKGCGGQAQGSAHIISQARCKQIHKSELIWLIAPNGHPVNFFPACYNCNIAIENPKGQAWKKLNNIDYCLCVMQQYDEELYNKFIANI